MCMSFVAVGRSLTIVGYVAFKMAALWFWTMFNCNPPIAHCHPLLWGRGILVDHWSTISSFCRKCIHIYANIYKWRVIYIYGSRYQVEHKLLIEPVLLHWWFSTRLWYLQCGIALGDIAVLHCAIDMIITKPERVIMMPSLPSLVTSEIILTVTFGAISNNKVSVMTMVGNHHCFKTQIHGQLTTFNSLAPWKFEWNFRHVI